MRSIARSRVGAKYKKELADAVKRGYFAMRSFDRLVPIAVKIVAIPDELVTRKNLSEELAQFCNKVEVASPPVDRRLCGHYSDAQVCAWCACELCRDRAAHARWAAEIQGFSERIRGFRGTGRGVSQDWRIRDPYMQSRLATRAVATAS